MNPNLRVWLPNSHLSESSVLRYFINLVFCTLVQMCINFAHKPLGFSFRVFHGSNGDFWYLKGMNVSQVYS
jgi:hypothetical protein